MLLYSGEKYSEGSLAGFLCVPEYRNVPPEGFLKWSSVRSERWEVRGIDPTNGARPRDWLEISPAEGSQHNVDIRRYRGVWRHQSPPPPPPSPPWLSVVGNHYSPYICITRLSWLAGEVWSSRCLLDDNVTMSPLGLTLSTTTKLEARLRWWWVWSSSSIMMIVIV